MNEQGWPDGEGWIRGSDELVPYRMQWQPRPGCALVFCQELKDGTRLVYVANDPGVPASVIEQCAAFKRAERRCGLPEGVTKRNGWYWSPDAAIGDPCAVCGIAIAQYAGHRSHYLKNDGPGLRISVHEGACWQHVPNGEPPMVPFGEIEPGDVVQGVDNPEAFSDPWLCLAVVRGVPVFSNLRSTAHEAAAFRALESLYGCWRRLDPALDLTDDELTMLKQVRLAKQ